MLVPYHFYSCVSCLVNFGVEAHEDIDHSDVVCPICQSDDSLEDVEDNVNVPFNR